MADTFKTRDQLLARAGTDLGLVQPGETLSPEDKETLDNLFDPLIAQLAADGVFYVQDPNAIEVEIFLPLASLLANTAGPSFGSPINDGAMTRDQNALRRISAPEVPKQALKVDFF